MDYHYNLHAAIYCSNQLYMLIELLKIHAAQTQCQITEPTVPTI